MECGKIIFEPLNISKGYHAISLKEENYVYFSDDEDSLNNKDKDKDKGNSNDDIKIEKKMKHSRMQQCRRKTKSRILM
jgi:hypothetical protein